MSIHLERCISLNDRLFEAVQAQDKSSLLELLKAKISYDCCDANGVPLIVEAARQGFHEGLRILAPLCDLNKRDNQECSALHISAKKGDEVACQILLEEGADPDVRNLKGRSPLYCAACKGHMAVLQCFITAAPLGTIGKRHPINFNAPSYPHLSTPLIAACYRSQIAVAELLVQSGAAIDHRDSSGYTAKAICVMRGLTGSKIDQIPMDPYTEEFLRRKILAHFAGIKKKSVIDGTQFFVTGAFSPFIHKQISKFLEEYFRDFCTFLSLEDKSLVLEAICFSSHEHSAAAYFDHFQKDKITIVIAGWHRHAINVIFYDRYLCVVNAGEGVPSGCSILETTVIDKDLVSEETFQQIRDQFHRPMKEASHFFYVTLPETLAPKGQQLQGKVQDNLCRVIAATAPRTIGISICCMAAGKGSVRFSIMIIKMIRSAEENLRSLACNARIECKNYSLYCKRRALECYLEDHFVPSRESKIPCQRKSNCSLDKQLIHSVYIKVKKQTEKSRPFRLSENRMKLACLTTKFPQILVD